MDDDIDDDDDDVSDDGADDDDSFKHWLGNSGYYLSRKQQPLLC